MYPLDMNNGEHWKPTDFEHLEVSDLGRVRRLERLLEQVGPLLNGRWSGNQRKSIPAGLVSAWIQNGYPCIDFVLDGKKHRRYVHRLVAHAFLGESYFDGATVDHINGDRRDNRAENLRWVTVSENTRMQNSDGRGAGRGLAHPLGKFDDADWPQVVAMRAAGHSLSDCGTAFGVSGSLIHKIEKGLKRPWLTAG